LNRAFKWQLWQRFGRPFKDGLTAVIKRITRSTLHFLGQGITTIAYVEMKFVVRE